MLREAQNILTVEKVDRFNSFTKILDIIVEREMKQVFLVFELAEGTLSTLTRRFSSRRKRLEPKLAKDILF